MTTEMPVQDGQFTEEIAPVPTTALAKREADPLAQRTEGMRFLEEMDDAEFDRRLAGLKKRQARIERVHRDVLVLDVDYGKVAGAPRDFLFKAGAEKLCALYGLVPSFRADVQCGDGIEAPALLVVVTCELRHGSETGPGVGSGLGSASSWETKHRWRLQKPYCPSCGKDLRRSKDGNGFYCWTKTGGCGWTGNVDTSVLGRIENTEPWDLHNTLLKMAEKRAHVDATLRTTATSGLFSQDEDAVDHGRDAHGTAQPAAAPPETPTPAPAKGPGMMDRLAACRTLPEVAAWESEALEKARGNAPKEAAISKFAKARAEQIQEAAARTAAMVNAGIAPATPEPITREEAGDADAPEEFPEDSTPF